MSLLLETSLGDICIDLDIEGSPLLCKNILKLAKARYYTNTLVYNVQHGRFCQLGDPEGDGSGGSCIDGLIDTINNSNDTSDKPVDVKKSSKRFLRSNGRVLSKDELQEKGRVVAIEMGMKDTIGSQFMLTIDSGELKSLDGMVHSDKSGRGEKDYLSLGVVSEDDDDVLGKINSLYCDKAGRPYADVRIVRAHILDDPFDDPDGLDIVLSRKGVRFMSSSDLPEKYAECSRWLASASPSYLKPQEEVVEERISTEEAIKDVDEETEKKRREELAKKESHSNAAMLEMLGDLPSADLKPPENVLFVCKLNPITEDDDLELIFSRFDPNAKAEIIRDPDTGDSLHYAFVEFGTERACNEAYFKMNNALIDDRRIKVDFSQSVAKEWNKYAQKRRGGKPNSIYRDRKHHKDGRRPSFQQDQPKHCNREHDDFGRLKRYRSKSSERRKDHVDNSRRRGERRHRSRSADASRDFRRNDRYDDRKHRSHREISRSQHHSSENYADRHPRSTGSDRYERRRSRSMSSSRSSSSSRSRRRRKRSRRREKGREDRRKRHDSDHRERRKKHHKKSSRKRSRQDL